MEHCIAGLSITLGNCLYSVVFVYFVSCISIHRITSLVRGILRFHYMGKNPTFCSVTFFHLPFPLLLLLFILAYTFHQLPLRPSSVHRARSYAPAFTQNLHRIHFPHLRPQKKKKNQSSYTIVANPRRPFPLPSSADILERKTAPIQIH